jgi:hypothetical protein
MVEPSTRLQIRTGSGSDRVVVWPDEVSFDDHPVATAPGSDPYVSGTLLSNTRRG